MSTKKPEWLYFGCHEQPGHFLFSQGMYRSNYRSTYNVCLEAFDGLLPPQEDRTAYRATVTRFPGLGVTALAFWDYAVDKRAGSNSIIFAPSADIPVDELLETAPRMFPEVFARMGAEGLVVPDIDKLRVYEMGVKMHGVVRAFVDKHHISCPETIYQSDDPIVYAYELMEELSDIAGYYEYDDDE